LESGLCFRYEKELQDRLQSYLVSNLHSGRSNGQIALRREVHVGRVIPDFVIIDFSECVIFDEIPKRWSYRHAWIVSQLRSRSPLHCRTIAARGFEREENIQSCAADLLSAGFVIQTSTGSLVLSDWFSAFRPRVVSIEAKLSSWKDAISQAQSYRLFSDEVVVALDAGATCTIEIQRTFESFGIGLWFVGQDDTREVVRPTASSPVSTEKEYISMSAITSTLQNPWLFL